MSNLRAYQPVYAQVSGAQEVADVMRGMDGIANLALRWAQFNESSKQGWAQLDINARESAQRNAQSRAATTEIRTRTGHLKVKLPYDLAESTARTEFSKSQTAMFKEQTTGLEIDNYVKEHTKDYRIEGAKLANDAATEGITFTKSQTDLMKAQTLETNTRTRGLLNEHAQKFLDRVGGPLADNIAISNKEFEEFSTKASFNEYNMFYRMGNAGSRQYYTNEMGANGMSTGKVIVSPGDSDKWKRDFKFGDATEGLAKTLVDNKVYGDRLMLTRDVNNMLQSTFDGLGDPNAIPKWQREEVVRKALKNVVDAKAFVKEAAKQGLTVKGYDDIFTKGESITKFADAIFEQAEFEWRAESARRKYIQGIAVMKIQNRTTSYIMALHAKVQAGKITDEEFYAKYEDLIMKLNKGMGGMVVKEAENITANLKKQKGEREQGPADDPMANAGAIGSGLSAMTDQEIQAIFGSGVDQDSLMSLMEELADTSDVSAVDSMSAGPRVSKAKAKHEEEVGEKALDLDMKGNY